MFYTYIHTYIYTHTHYKVIVKTKKKKKNPPPFFHIPTKSIGGAMGFALLIVVFLVFCDRSILGMAKGDQVNGMTLDTVRDALVRQEDTIIFYLIERAKFPMNSPTYDKSKVSIPGSSASLVEFIVKETEAAQAKAGRFKNPEEHPFFPRDMPPSLVPPYNYPLILHRAADSINVNDKIWNMYFEKLLPLLTKPGDDGNYASTASSDLNCLQAISRRIHYGNFVAEVKFRDAPQDYEPAIRAQDRDALMNLLTFKAQEEMVKKRVEKKATIFSQEVTLNDTASSGNYKINPSLVSRLYDEWIMPLTKDVEVEYLLRRLD